MSNSISSLTSSLSQLFSRLDTKSQGYLEKSDFESALNQLNSSTSSADNLFSALDSDSDGKVTESEFSSTLSQLQSELDSQFNQMRMHGMGGHGPQGMSGNMPPPPPPENDEGFTQDELTSQLEEIGSSDSKRSEFISNVVNNFAAADTDGNGKVSFAEARALNESLNTSSSSSETSGTSSASSSANNNAQLIATIMQLMHAYGSSNSTTTTASTLLSTSA